MSDFFFPNSSYAVTEKVSVNVTPPPNQQVVWKVSRQLLQQKIYRANVIASLREKYGKETATSPLVADDRQLTDMWWILDEQGRPVRLPAPQGNFADAVQMVDYCSQTLGGSWFAPSNLERYLNGLNPSDWCSSAGIGVHASLGGQQEIVGDLQVDIFHVPLAVRSAKTEMTFVTGIGKRRQQQEIDQSKQARPKL